MFFHAVLVGKESSPLIHGECFVSVSPGSALAFKINGVHQDSKEAFRRSDGCKTRTKIRSLARLLLESKGGDQRVSSILHSIYRAPDPSLTALFAFCLLSPFSSD